jgi:hypothetical protein
VCWCIHPLDAYRFRLYREPGRALDYVYAAETAAFHDWRSTGRARLPNSKALIQDKTALAGLLSRHQIPVVKTLASPTALQQQRPLSELMGDTQHVFCKMNGGHMGIGAFAAWRTPSGVAGKKLTGEVLVDSAAVDIAWQALCQLDQPLIQPFLQNHPAIAALSHDGTVIRVRLATEWTYNHPSANEPVNSLIAFMVVPAGQSASLAPINMVFPIVMDSGQLGQPLHPIVMSDAYVQAYTRISQILPPDFTLPCWSELNTHSHRCHQLMTDIQSIAWDWVITSTGPVLLEGNTAWGLNIPQQITGGFLTRSFNW